jgi:hypothetical protein
MATVGIAAASSLGLISAPETLFWLAALGAAPQWSLAVLFPRAKLTAKLWNPQYAALPLALAFSAAVLPRLAWWLTRFARADLSLANLRRDFAGDDDTGTEAGADSDSGSPAPGWPFLLLWLYILAFDIEVFAHMHVKLLARKSSAVEMSSWALVTALCAPLGYALFSLLEILTRDAEEVDEAAEKAAAAALYAGKDAKNATRAQAAKPKAQ